MIYIYIIHNYIYIKQRDILSPRLIYMFWHFQTITKAYKVIITIYITHKPYIYSYYIYYCIIYYIHLLHIYLYIWLYSFISVFIFIYIYAYLRKLVNS